MIGAILTKFGRVPTTQRMEFLGSRSKDKIDEPGEETGFGTPESISTVDSQVKEKPRHVDLSVAHFAVGGRPVDTPTGASYIRGAGVPHRRCSLPGNGSRLPIWTRVFDRVGTPGLKDAVLG